MRALVQWICSDCKYQTDEPWTRSPRCPVCGKGYLKKQDGRLPHQEPAPPRLSVVPPPQPSPRPDEDPEGRGASDEARPHWQTEVTPRSRPVPITEVDVSAEHARFPTAIESLDLVLGGGAVVGSLIILGGAPGAGKSTLLMQAVALAECGGTRLYATGEESEVQVSLRAERLGARRSEILLVREADLEAIFWHAADPNVRLLVVDSLHKVRSSRTSGLAGSDQQVKVCADLLMDFAKDTGKTVIAISHINAEGKVSGPMAMQHAGDATLMLRKVDEESPVRTLRALKNRFADETIVGWFRMAPEGLISLAAEEARTHEAASHDSASRDDLLPVVHELYRRYLTLGGVMDDKLRDRLAGRPGLELDLLPPGGS